MSYRHRYCTYLYYWYLKTGGNSAKDLFGIKGFGNDGVANKLPKNATTMSPICKPSRILSARLSRRVSFIYMRKYTFYRKVLIQENTHFYRKTGGQSLSKKKVYSAIALHSAWEFGVWGEVCRIDCD
jgi:hypothetical protein